VYVVQDIPYMLLILWMLFSHHVARDCSVYGDTPMSRRNINTRGLAMRSKQPTASFSMYAMGCFRYLCISKVRTLFNTVLWHCFDEHEPCCITGSIPLSSNLCCTGLPRASRFTWLKSDSCNAIILSLWIRRSPRFFSSIISTI
jgi:hypothetical protein